MRTHISSGFGKAGLVQDVGHKKTRLSTGFQEAVDPRLRGDDTLAKPRWRAGQCVT